MAINLVLKPEIEAQLIAQAAAKGIPVEQYLQSWIETNLVTETAQPFHQTETPEEWVELLEAFTNNPALANVPPLSDEAISRESIYREREDSQL
ncbi:MAG: hypothetical protein HC862_14185 [Scytonema sp. RU_4_4]|nr:hypothetical protein [Scytonema sp. RU_4_4]NJR75430.1 hypothetical protein [Scytonema sp. CRU_2_7]